jgi:hypothetical protein
VVVRSKETVPTPEGRERMAQVSSAIRHHSIPLLGSSVGLGMNRADHCLVLLLQQSIINLFNAIAHADMPVQCALLLLRLSGVPRVTPAIIRQACEIFDALIMRSVTDKTNLPDPATSLVVRRAVTTAHSFITNSMVQLNGSLCSSCCCWANRLRDA